MSVWGVAGRAAWNSYKNNLNLGLLKRTMSTAYRRSGPTGGAYGAYTAFNRWTRGYGGSGKSTIGMLAARKGTVIAAGALIAGTLGGGVLGGRNMMNPNKRKAPAGTMY